ncbi:MAG: RidA family protein [Cyclobacteriaceae bacterium]
MMKQRINTSNAPAPIGPYSQAIKKGDTLYVSGQIAINPETGEMNTGEISAETEQVMKNLSAILSEAGMSFDNIVKTTIFIKNMQQFAQINAVYGKYFGDVPPARETVEVSGLPKYVNVEISCIAID